MENSVPQDPRAGMAIGTTAKSPTRIDIAIDSAHEILMRAQEVEQRLHLVVERLDGSRPTEAQQESAVDQPGSMGSLLSKQSDSRMLLDRCCAWLTELEQLV